MPFEDHKALISSVKQLKADDLPCLQSNIFFMHLASYVKILHGLVT